MLDYKGLEALATVISEQSFERAAQKLFITQPAVSQRIRNLEDFYGSPLLIRGHPYRANELGQQLIGHFKKMSFLEEELSLKIEQSGKNPQLSIGLNRDSLETWFMHLLAEQRLGTEFILEIIADDQELLLDYFRNGLLSASMSPSSKKLSGSECEFLGFMDYVLVSSPKFYKKYFSQGLSSQALLKAPALFFDKNDSLHRRYLEKFFGLKNEPIPSHFIPSVQGFKSFALNGLGYALIPKTELLLELKEGLLINLAPDKIWQEPIYWHYLSIQSTKYQSFMKVLMDEVKNILSSRVFYKSFT